MSELNIQRFTKRPIEIQAVQLTEDNVPQVAEWCSGFVVDTVVADPAHPSRMLLVPQCLDIPTSEGWLRGCTSDWVIMDEVGEFYPCPAEKFETTHDYAGDVSHPDQPELPLDL